MSHPLDGCRAKLERAKSLLQELDRATNAFIATEAGPKFFGTEETDPQGRVWFGTRVQIPDPFPMELGLIAGDAIHNTRSALDHLVCRLVEARGKQPSNRTAFPIRETRPMERNAKNSIKAQLDGLSAAHKDSILRLQPYERRGTAEAEQLLLLSFLDNADKHRVVMPTLMHVEHGPVSDYQSNVDIDWQWGPRNVPLNDGDLIARWSPRDTFDGALARIGMAVRPDITFGAPGATVGHLEEIRAYVVGIVESFAPEFPK